MKKIANKKKGNKKKKGYVLKKSASLVGMKSRKKPGKINSVVAARG